MADLRCVGLTIRVTANSAKSWSLRFRDPRSGKVTRATIGGYPEITLERARETGLNLRREIANGVNPVEKKRKERVSADSRTFEALAKRYVAEHARRHKKTADADERGLRLHVLPQWRTRSIESIGRSDVIELCEGVVAKGSPIQANRVQALISKVFSFAVDSELIGANPCARLKKRSKEVRGTRVLSDDEIRLFWRIIGRSPTSPRIAYRCAGDRNGGRRDQGVRSSRRCRHGILDCPRHTLQEWPGSRCALVEASDIDRP
jgi:hypothetical protein